MGGWTIRQATAEDRPSIEGLLSGARWKHFHLDWQQPAALADRSPFLVAAQSGLPIGCLACPPDVTGYAWIRAFASASGYEPRELWNTLWERTIAELHKLEVPMVGALPSDDWFMSLLAGQGFEHVKAVMFYEMRIGAGAALPAASAQTRPLETADFEGVLELDHSAFEPAWQLSRPSLEAALETASSASVIEQDRKLKGYQITTGSPLGFHLARLAVNPRSQRKGYGTALTLDAIQTAAEHHAEVLTVNTQDDNLGSRNLYTRLGFKETGRRYPLYQRKL